MKNFEQFIKEEIDLRGNKGIGDDFMRNADDQTRKNLNIRIDDPSQLRTFGPEIMRLLDQSKSFLSRGLNPEQLEERFVKLEDLARKLVISEYGDILEASEKPVELDIRLVRPNSTVIRETPKLRDVPSKPENQPGFEKLEDDDIKASVDKKKILNMLTQGEAKATKDIMKYSDIIEEGLQEIFGDSYKEILDIWLKTTEVANKMDWIIPVEHKADMMKQQPDYMAGSVDLEWKKDDEESQDEESQEEPESQESQDEESQSQEEPESYDRIIIKAIGVDFPMLLHEAIKGIFMLLQSGAIKKDEELAKIISLNTSSFSDEAQDFRYGMAAQSMLRDYVNTCKDSDKYPNARLKIFALMSLDKGNGGRFTDVEFLEMIKEMFSCFDRVEEDNKINFKLNKFRFDTSKVKTTLESIINDINVSEDEYEKSVSNWEMEQKFGSNKPAEKAPSKVEKGEEYVPDYSEMTPSELNVLINKALDEDDYETVSKISPFLDSVSYNIYKKDFTRIEEKLKYKK